MPATSGFCKECNSFQGARCAWCGVTMATDTSNFCANCNRYQNRLWDWVSFLGISTFLTAAPLPFALIVYLYSYAHAPSPFSNVEISELKCTRPESISVYAENTGNRPAIVQPEAKLSNGKTEYPVEFFGPDANLRIRESSGGVLRFAVRNKTNDIPFDALAINTKECPYVLTFSVKNFGATSGEQRKICVCSNLQ